MKNVEVSNLDIAVEQLMNRYGRSAIDSFFELSTHNFEYRIISNEDFVFNIGKKDLIFTASNYDKEFLDKVRVSYCITADFKWWRENKLRDLINDLLSKDHIHLNLSEQLLEALKKVKYTLSTITLDIIDAIPGKMEYSIEYNYSYLVIKNFIRRSPDELIVFFRQLPYAEPFLFSTGEKNLRTSSDCISAEKNYFFISILS